MRITFDYNQPKAFQVILWFLGKHGGRLEKLKLVKLIFFADQEHLHRYGRPIVGGPYVAMPLGPVASQCLDDMDACRGPFELEGHYVVGHEAYREEMLSESDLEILEAIDAQYGRFDAFHLRDITHSLNAWRENYVDGTSSSLPYEDFFKDFDDSSMLEIIREDQEARELLNS